MSRGNPWLGHRKDAPLKAIDPVEAHTTYFDAGAIRIGLESRELNAAIVGAHFSAMNKQTSAEELAEFNDEGLSVHVLDAESGFEHLRFDMFGEDPHYHYFFDDHFLVIGFDQSANGDMWEWVLMCLRNRLPDMLRFAKATALAERVDIDAIDHVASEMDKLRMSMAE